jgi:hypothetical protein
MLHRLGAGGQHRVGGRGIGKVLQILLFETHAEESAAQVERLQQVFELIGRPARAKTCEAMQTSFRVS